MTSLRASALAAVTAACVAAPVRAEELLLALSSQQVTIASNYAGSDLTLFGAIRPGRRLMAEPGSWDVVVTVRGPAETLVVREKERAGPFWFNSASRRFPRVPAYLAVLSSRPLVDVAAPDLRRDAQLGLLQAASARPSPGRSPAEDAAFASALVRLQVGRHLWSEEPGGVAFLDATLFRATVHLPPNVPFGAFETEVRLLSKGAPIARETITFRVVKAGFEARVADLADGARLAYGVGAALLALAFGWAANVMFRRD